MIFEEMLRDERAEGKAESILKFLEDVGGVPEELRKTIMEQRDLEMLDDWMKLAAKADSAEQFAKEIRN